MGDFDNIGELMHLPLESINLVSNYSVPQFMIKIGAEAILNSHGRNWVPVIVQETSMYEYQVVSNHLVYLASKQAELERVWCFVISPEAENITQAKLLTRETFPQVNLCTADQEMIFSVLNYLSSLEGSPLKGVNVGKAAAKIANANRAIWKSFNPITKLKCGIVSDQKIKSLQKIFYLQPPPPPPLPEPVSLKTATRDEVYERLIYLKEYQIGGFEKVNIEQATTSILSADKTNWRNLKPITKLRCGIGEAKVNTLKQVFRVE
ncbi:hypothetical protein [Dactylococcopsis salina]|uniref:Uncharacterized protein n=1 Tax=Dactylococcopsis salina (strain PCC 8305) TaxID=13035 RepID=K9YZA2_DACS8|nr:hypothetical protein [Dactylococcopsis salina]AFZ51817.1 hypothetical protein Dacsa_3310 [Dactylococcopsis salina PCC 8305]